MRRVLLGCAIVASIFVTGTAHAECSVSSDPGAAVRPLNATVSDDVHLIVSMTMLPKLMHLDYESAAKKSGCNLGRLVNGDADYELWGDDSGMRQRKAVPRSAGAPIALILPVIDIMKRSLPQKRKSPRRFKAISLEPLQGSISLAGAITRQCPTRTC